MSLPQSSQGISLVAIAFCASLLAGLTACESEDTASLEHWQRSLEDDIVQKRSICGHRDEFLAQVQVQEQLATLYSPRFPAEAPAFPVTGARLPLRITGEDTALVLELAGNGGATALTEALDGWPAGTDWALGSVTIDAAHWQANVVPARLPDACGPKTPKPPHAELPPPVTISGDLSARHVALKAEEDSLIPCMEEMRWLSSQRKCLEDRRRASVLLGALRLGRAPPLLLAFIAGAKPLLTEAQLSRADEWHLVLEGALAPGTTEEQVRHAVVPELGLKVDSIKLGAGRLTMNLYSRAAGDSR